MRRFAEDQGLDVPPVHALVTDRAGAIWIGTTGGLYRFDGSEFRQWSPDGTPSAVVRLAASHDGRVAAQFVSGRIIQVSRDGTSSLPDPPGGWAPDVRTVAYDADGALWSVIGDGTLARYTTDGWKAMDGGTFAGQAVRRVVSHPAGVLLVLTDAGLWELDPSLPRARHRFDAPVMDVAPAAGGRLLLLTHDSRVIELADGRSREVASHAAGDLPQGRPIALVERKGTIWVALDRFLVALREGRAPEVLGARDGLDSGGPLLVGPEGSLWVGGFAALYQFPEPETTIWNERAGLPGPHARFIARSGDGLWVTTWQGTRLIRADEGYRVLEVPGVRSSSRPCVDPLGTTWFATTRGVVRVSGDQVVGRLPIQATFLSCAPATDSSSWIGASRGLFLASGSTGSLEAVEALPADMRRIEAVLQDRAARLWITDGARVCHAAAARVRAAAGTPATRTGGHHPVAWSCEPLPEPGDAAALLEVRDGTLWLATRHAGVLTRGPDGWMPLRANADLPTRDVFALVPSPSGGVWMAGHGILQRVRPGGPEGWTVLETPGPGNGLPAAKGADLVEDKDGGLWITTSVGLVHLPPGARELGLEPPPVLLVDARVDVDPVPLTSALELPADRNRLELRFAALSFREPGRVRYQARLSPDDPWVGTLGRPSVRWVDLPPGHYRAEVRASLDGRLWSPDPARFEFSVLAPWYRTPWAFTLFAATIGLLLWAAYRARTAYLVGLERQRTRIAMDLHDELGSGLGSIGILAGLLPTGRIDEEQRDSVASEIATTAADLGSALADIVWSLDPRSATLEEVATRMAEHGDRLFAGDDVVFRVHGPREWPGVKLPLPLRRNLLLIGLEALHNAARHSGARNVKLAWAEVSGTWQLTISDDGIGLNGSAPADGRRGRGLPGMKRRTAEIGGRIEWRATPSGGTRVRLRFAIPGLLMVRTRARPSRGGGAA
ncbi:MAG TPA: ATP-binding protein [Longimicrobiales bacterium]|nr:ATP-binding protein [Longimicrobiales bacterium]